MLVTAIMPTFNRRHLLPVALASFLAQDWPEKELVIVDDGDDPIVDLVVDLKGTPVAPFLEKNWPVLELHCDTPRIRYIRSLQRFTIGAKRNMACLHALGDIIVHFDDDDWSAPTRISDQVDRLIASGAQMSGYHSIYFWDQTHGNAYHYEGDANYAVGTSMCYRRDWWEAHPFPDQNHAEDNELVFAARAERGGLVSADGSQMIVARAHGSNTGNCARIGHNSWPQVSPTLLPPAFFEATS